MGGKANLAVFAIAFTLAPWNAHAQFIDGEKVATEIRAEPFEVYKAWIFFQPSTAEADTTQECAQFNSRAERRRAKVGRKRRGELDECVDPAYLGAIEGRVERVRTVSRWFNAVSVEATGETLEELADLPFVSRVEKVEGARRPQFEPPVFTALKPIEHPKQMIEELLPVDYGSSYFQLKRIGVPELHKRNLTGRGITICLLDSGFRKSHPAFRRTNLIAEWDFVFNDGNVEHDPNVRDDYSDDHGTMTWSILGSYVPGKMVGPAFEADFLLAKTEDLRSETPMEEDFWVEGLEWCDHAGADIVSSSLGYRFFDRSDVDHTYEDLNGDTTRTARAVNIATEQGILVVNSVGNDGFRGSGSLSTPADAFGVLSVGAVNTDDTPADFSSLGPTVDGRIKPEVVAPGVEVFVACSDRPNRDGWNFKEGTSMAAPLVAGVAALLLQAHPDWTPAHLREAIMQTANRANFPDNKVGWGMISAAAAADYAPKGIPSIALLEPLRR